MGERRQSGKGENQIWVVDRRETQRIKRINVNKQPQQMRVGDFSRDPGDETLLGFIGNNLSQNAQHWGKRTQRVHLKYIDRFTNPLSKFRIVPF